MGNATKIFIAREIIKNPDGQNKKYYYMENNLNAAKLGLNELFIKFSLLDKIMYHHG